MGNYRLESIKSSILKEHQMSLLYPYNFKEEIISTKTQEIKLVSLFSGCGGLDLGFIGGFRFRDQEYPKTKFKVVLSNDFDTSASLVYQSNRQYFDHDILIKDICLIEDSEIPEFDFLTAGFPCQPFSNAGLRKGINDDRGNLFSKSIDIFTSSIRQGKKPIGFMFENVRGILSSKMPDGITVPDEIVKRMEKLGYSTNYKLVKSSDYGVPSNRYRVIIIGFRKDIGYFNFDILDQVVWENSIPNFKTSPYELYLGSILSDIPDDAKNKNDYWKYSPSGQYMVESIGICQDGEEALQKFKLKIPLKQISETISKGRSWKDMEYDKMSPRFQRIWDAPEKYRSPNFYRRFALGEINGTIIASAQPENCGITHPFLNRRFTIREIARIQSFPDGFEFPYKSISDAYKVIGNAVPPILGWVLATSIEKFLSNNLK